MSRSVLAARDSCGLLVCSFHWGDEYRDYPTVTQKRLGHLAIDLGARIVHGHHPHVLEGVEFYHDGLIAYSLGNFIFDQRHEKPRQSSLLAVVMKGTVIDSVFMRPLEIVNDRPQPAKGAGWKVITKRLMKQCIKLGTALLVQDSLLCLKPLPTDIKKPR